jgi:rare lipoprotein A
MYSLTAAHRTLPLGTRVMVTNLVNGKAVMVRINDRGPFVEGRAIDLSYSAARQLDMIEEGLTRVRIEPVDGSPPHLLTAGGPYSVQVASFADPSNAKRLLVHLRQSYPGVHITTVRTPTATYYRVRMGTFTTREEALAVAMRLTRQGYTPLITESQQ